MHAGYSIHANYCFGSSARCNLFAAAPTGLQRTDDTRLCSRESSFLLANYDACDTIIYIDRCIPSRATSPPASTYAADLYLHRPICTASSRTASGRTTSLSCTTTSRKETNLRWVHLRTRHAPSTRHAGVESVQFFIVFFNTTRHRHPSPRGTPPSDASSSTRRCIADTPSPRFSATWSSSSSSSTHRRRLVHKMDT